VPIIRIVFGDRATVAEKALIPCLVVPLVVLCALMYAHRIPMRHRHLVLLLPATVTLATLWIARTRPGLPRVISATSLIALLLAFVVSFEIDPQYPEDWRQVGDCLVRQMVPGEHILVFDPDRVLPLTYYLGSGAAVSGLPIDPDLDHYEPSQYAIRDSAVVAARLAAIGATGGVWLVEANRLMPALQSSPAVIDGYMRRHYVVRAPVHFRGVQVTHLEPRSHAR
jgi:hypothetical protein